MLLCSGHDRKVISYRVVRVIYYDRIYYYMQRCVPVGYIGIGTSYGVPCVLDISLMDQNNN